MSITVYKKKKNGETVPIKVSIWDAFQGCPAPRRSKKVTASASAIKCVCCGKPHGLTTPTANSKSQDVKQECVGVDNKDSNKVVNKPEEKEKPVSNESKNNSNSSNGETPANNKTSPVLAFTNEEDQLIMRMKSEVPPLPWTKISEELGGKRTKNEINERYKVLKAKLASSADGDGKKEENAAKPDNAVEAQPQQAEAKQDQKQETKQDQKQETKQDQKQEAKQDQKQEAKQEAKQQEAKQQEAKQEAKQDQKQDQKKKDEASTTAAAAPPPPPGDNLVKFLADRYDKQKWIVIASRHFDKTGQRITPEQARELAEGR